tara:strand:+ start:1537 stop:2787 length:1251 start_codon:yes stop_codon:yes gene_type:complete
MNNQTITIVGLGYTGLPLLIEFFKKGYSVNGFDKDKKKIKRLKLGIDLTKELKKKDLRFLKNINFVDNIHKVKKTDFIIIAVPTPIDKKNKPDLRLLIDASKEVSKILKEGNIIIYESTVYPGCTEEVCVPVLEKFSGLKFNKNFYCGYSPERINPGDQKRKLSNVIKVTSGSTKLIARKIDKLYKSIIKAGTHLAPSIRTAEAAKVIENIQRDLNIALINELAMLFDRLNLNTSEVLKAAGTKWNFHSYKPGLVGGHCISVDPYYLTYKAIKKKFNPQMILSGRKTNNSVPKFIANKIKDRLNNKRSEILILGFTFKENCPDFRNSKIVDLTKELKNNKVYIYDPLVNVNEVKIKYKLNFLKNITNKKFDVIILAVAHDVFRSYLKNKVFDNLKVDGFIYDVKSYFKPNGRIISF